MLNDFSIIHAFLQSIGGFRSARKMAFCISVCHFLAWFCLQRSWKSRELPCVPRVQALGLGLSRPPRQPSNLLVTLEPDMSERDKTPSSPTKAIAKFCLCQIRIHTSFATSHRSRIRGACHRKIDSHRSLFFICRFKCNCFAELIFETPVRRIRIVLAGTGSVCTG